MPTLSDITNAEILWNYHCYLSPIEQGIQNRIVLGLGSYDLRVTDYCAELYLNKFVDKILFTGKSGNWTVGRYNKTEAEIFADRAIELGVPKEDILLEKHATNIGENIRLSKIILEESKLPITEVILVTKPNTTRRAYATFMVYWPSMKVTMSAPAVKFNNPAINQTLNDIIHEVVGDIERIIAYPEKGFQIAQEIPAEVIAAYKTLYKNGYTNHCQNKEI